MKTIKSALFTMLALLAFTSSSSAFSLNGGYVEVATSAVGAELAGTVKDADSALASSDSTTGQVGKTAVTMTYGLGYMTSRLNKLGLDVGYMWTPGEAKISTSSTDSTASGITFEISDSTESVSYTHLRAHET